MAACGPQGGSVRGPGAKSLRGKDARRAPGQGPQDKGALLVVAHPCPGPTTASALAARLVGPGAVSRPWLTTDDDEGRRRFSRRARAAVPGIHSRR
jgi:hypothetical protein